jgi:hypothetical protein
VRTDMRKGEWTLRVAAVTPDGHILVSQEGRPDLIERCKLDEEMTNKK